MAQLIEGMKGYADSVLNARSFLVEYEVPISEKLAESKYGQEVGGFRILLGKMGRSVYSHVDPSKSGLDKPVFTAVYHDKVYSVHRGRQLIIHPELLGEGYVWWEYTANLFLDVYRDMDIPERARRQKYTHLRQSFLPETILAARQKYKVLPFLEEVEGAACHVLERPGVDRIWVDAALGFVVRKRDMSWGEGLPRALVVENRDFREVRGIPFPWEQVRTSYADPRFEAKELWGVAIHRRSFKVLRLELDTLNDGFFRLDVPDGTTVIDDVRNVEYIKQSPDAPPFEETIARARRAIAPSSGLQGYYWVVSLSFALLSMYLLTRIRWGRRAL